MNTNNLKKFARETRTKLINLVSAKLTYALAGQSAELRERRDQIGKLIQEIDRTSREQVIEKVAYTWFNRFIALRFMDINDYQPLGLRVLSPKDGYTLPELLDEAKNGNIPEELRVDADHLSGLLDARIPSADPQNEVYKELLIAACNHLHQVLPFLFERINDFTELLLPDDLTSELSIIQEIRDGMDASDCGQVEVIGWLYQFYIAEKKDQVFASGEKVKKEDIPAATQLFTPRWIVEYMVQNTLGKLWLQNKPQSGLRAHMPYFIDSPVLYAVDHLQLSSPQEIRLLDQACGSGHILVYAFELLAKIYEEEGYNQSEIATLILTKNLFGLEIDERAAQLAGMALLMKAREYQRRLFKKNPVPEPQIVCYSDLKITPEEIKAALASSNAEASDALLHDLNNMRQATNLGSLVQPHAAPSEIVKVRQNVGDTLQKSSDAFLNLQLTGIMDALHQLSFLGAKYHCVVDNPPYMGSGNMNAPLSAFVKINYPDSKADLMACFMEAGLQALHPQGFLGMINQHSWMFLSSYEDLRKVLLSKVTFDTLLHLGPRTFPEIAGEVVQNSSFTLWNKLPAYDGIYSRLVDFEKTDLKRLQLLDSIQNKNETYFYSKNQQDFFAIPGAPIAYWIGSNELSIYAENRLLSNFGHPAKGIDTGENDFFLRLWPEININDLDVSQGRGKWVPYNKGGEFQRWYGNREYVVFWDNGIHLQQRKNWEQKKPTLRNQDKWFKEGYTWTTVSSGGFSARYCEPGALFDNGGCTFFADENLDLIGGFLNSKVASRYFEFLSPTLNFQPGGTGTLPISSNFFDGSIDLELIQQNKAIAKEDWQEREDSWLFEKNGLLKHKGQDIEECCDLYQHYWTNKFNKLHANEEALNRQFITLYNLQNEINPDVAFEKVTILKDEIAIKDQNLVFDNYKLITQLISYGVGCMFGRYSLDKDGLILAEQGESLEQYLTKIGKTRECAKFLPDADNIIPVLDDEWFEDDVVSCFHSFLKAAFGELDFRKNLAFVEECLGKDLRKYFMKDFYADHIKRYKKRPIYWLFSSPKGSFNVLVYLHRYTPDTLNRILNDYLIGLRSKLHVRMEHLDQVQITGSELEKSRAEKEKDRLQLVLIELQEYERDTLRPLAIQRVKLDLDEGVLVNYNKFGQAVKEVKGLNDANTKKKVKAFDWIDREDIR